MFFPISGVVISPLLLAGIGFLVGVLGGFFGVGGGFLAGPALFLLGVPANFVVGTDLAHMTGKSIVAARRHRALGHVDLKLGLLMIVGTMLGIEGGAQIIEYLEALDPNLLRLVLNVIYVVLLVGISALVFWEGISASRRVSDQTMPVREVSMLSSFTKRIQGIRIPPMVELPASGVKSISLWLVLFTGLSTGLLAGLLGVGGGFIRMPMLVYLLGIPTHVAVGTDLFEVVFSAGFGTLTHAVKGNVDILMAVVMHTGAAVGAQIGAQATRYVSGPRLRIAFAFVPLMGVIMLAIQLATGGYGPH